MNDIDLRNTCRACGERLAPAHVRTDIDLLVREHRDAGECDAD